MREQPGSGFDSEAARIRLEGVRNAVEPQDATTPERKLKVLKARARELARVPDESRASGSFLEVVLFALGEERYAIEAAHVTEVVRLDRLTPLPFTPTFVLGITSVRGQILSAVDLKPFFGLPDGQSHENRKLVLIRSGEICFGLVVDVVDGMRSIATDGMQASLPSLQESTRKFVKGVTPDGVVVLDGALLANEERLIVRKQLNV